MLSKTATPVPFKLTLNSPSFPNIAEDMLFLAVTPIFTFFSHARNIPSSIVTPPAPHSPTSHKIKYLYVGSNTTIPVPA